MQVGAPFLFLRQGRDTPGLIGWGRIRSQVYQRKHWDKAKRAEGRLSNEVQITFDWLCDPKSKASIPFATLSTDPLTKRGNWSAQASGTRLPAHVVAGVRKLWALHKTRLPSFKDLPPVKQVPRPELLEGAKFTTLVSVYERPRAARLQCLEAHGTVCFGCGFDFGAFYGPDAEGLIEVHHLKPISQSGGRRRVDPIKDLIPLCANCHRVVHMKKQEVMSLPGLKALVRRYGRCG